MQLRGQANEHAMGRSCRMNLNSNGSVWPPALTLSHHSIFIKGMNWFYWAVRFTITVCCHCLWCPENSEGWN